jgi:hypothetical protein
VSSPSRFRDSIGQLPTWPALAIAALLVVGIGAWSYGPAYQRCSELNAARHGLQAAIEEAGRAGTTLDLAAAMPGAWDEVRIAQGHKLARGQNPFHCPFGWDLSRDERGALIASGDYTLIGFFEAGQFQRYIEYRGDWARFEGDVGSLRRDQARFHVARSSGNPAVLTPAGR